MSTSLRIISLRAIECGILKSEDCGEGSEWAGPPVMENPLQKKNGGFQGSNGRKEWATLREVPIPPHPSTVTLMAVDNDLLLTERGV